MDLGRLRLARRTFGLVGPVAENPRTSTSKSIPDGFPQGNSLKTNTNPCPRQSASCKVAPTPVETADSDTHCRAPLSLRVVHRRV